MSASTQITGTEIFAFIAVPVFKVLCHLQSEKIWGVFLQN